MILGINCATENIAVAILQDNGEVLEKTWPGQTKRAEDLVIFIQELLQEAKIALAAITKIGVAIGPGAFTGLRLALVTTKTLGLALKIPVVPISTLLALAKQYTPAGNQKNIRVILDACRGDVSTALFTKDFQYLEKDHPVSLEKVLREPDALIIENQKTNAATVASLAQQDARVFNHEEILKLVPLYSHESRINLTNKPELQHLKIGNKAK